MPIAAITQALDRGIDAALADAGGPGRGLGGWTAACDGGFVARLRLPLAGPASRTSDDLASH